MSDGWKRRGGHGLDHAAREAGEVGAGEDAGEAVHEEVEAGDEAEEEVGLVALAGRSREGVRHDGLDARGLVGVQEDDAEGLGARA